LLGAELQSALRRYADTVEVDPDRLRQLEERINVLQTLKRKYGATLADVIAFGEEAPRRTCKIWKGGTPNWRA
jgi:DNA repair protein RecN (Recombination protein N)